MGIGRFPPDATRARMQFDLRESFMNTLIPSLSRSCAGLYAVVAELTVEAARHVELPDTSGSGKPIHRSSCQFGLAIGAYASKLEEVAAARIRELSPVCQSDTFIPPAGEELSQKLLSLAHAATRSCTLARQFADLKNPSRAIGALLVAQRALSEIDRAHAVLEGMELERSNQARDAAKKKRAMERQVKSNLHDLYLQQQTRKRPRWGTDDRWADAVRAVPDGNWMPTKRVLLRWCAEWRHWERVCGSPPESVTCGDLQWMILHSA